MQCIYRCSIHVSIDTYLYTEGCLFDSSGRGIYETRAVSATEPLLLGFADIFDLDDG